MTISNETIQIIKETPQYKELLKFLAEEALKLNTIADLKDKSITEIAEEVKARATAYDILKNILEPLIDLPKFDDKFDPNEFNV